MALSYDQKRKLLARTLPAEKEVRSRLQDYMDRTGLLNSDMAKRLGYATSSLAHFLRGTYQKVAGNSAPIRSAIVDFIEAHPIGVNQEASGRLYETENVRRIRKCFYEALDGRRAYFFRGAPGSQKTFVLQHLIAELNRAEISKNGRGRRAYYVYCRQDIRPNSLMKRVAQAAGSISWGETDRILRNLSFDIGQRKALFIFDEAHHLDIDCLETLRELLDMPPYCGLLFAGSHELEKIFQRLDMVQWHDRLRQGAELPGVSEDEALAIVQGELGPQSEPKVHSLIKKCYTTDLHKGRETKYISARLLFYAIQAIQERQFPKACRKQKDT
jgi:DNA transposition AAA+ family ATPase